MDLELKADFSVKSQHVSLYLRQKMKNYGQTEIQLDLTGMSDNIEDVVLGLRINEARFEYIDDSFINRLIKTYADDMKISLSAYRKKLPAIIKQDFANKKLKLSDRSIKNILAFIAKPKKIILTIDPSRPIAIENIKHYKVGDIPALLNIQVHLH